jgi:diguanylate cyclase (GGDEF)-like protein
VEKGDAQAALADLAAAIREASWELALKFVEEGLRDDAIPSLARLGQIGQLGDIPTFINELADELSEPKPGRLRRGSPLAARVRDHAREREALGFAPREIVTEFLILRRVLWNFVIARSSTLGPGDFQLVQQRLNDAIDHLVTECVVAYFDRATSELAFQVRRDALTGLLNHQAFTEELEAEIERGRRYDHGLALVFFDVDRFKAINDTFGHPEGDRVLRRIGQLLRDSLRGSDRAGRMGGDEFALLLVQTDPEVGGTLLERLRDSFDELAGAGELPADFSFSAGLANFPSDGGTPEALFRTADERLYQAKRASGAER